MAVIRLFTIFLASFLTTVAAICPLGWFRYGESCYYIIKRPLTWQQATDHCKEKNGTLVIPVSEMEQSFIWQTHVDTSYGLILKGLWIGCNDIEKEGNWQPCPLREESLGYENWGDVQPNNLKEQDCALMQPVFNGKWDDRPCSDAYYAVCQQPADPNTTPAYCLHTGSDGHNSSRCLVGHVVKELPADGVVSCGKACRLEPRCLSFNVLDDGEEKMTCQLNNVTSDAADRADLQETEYCYLFDI